MKKTVGIFAHVDAGKTTFSEQLLFHTDVIRTRGRVDNKDTFLDTHEVEKRRGITIFSDQATFSYNENTYYLIDTPGHVDFSSEMERSISILDYAVIIISGVDGVESHTETVYDLLKSQKKPIFFFINKMDQNHANLENIILELKNSLSESAIDFGGGFSENVAEEISMYNDELLEFFLENGYNEKLWDEHIVNLIRNQEIMPVFYGSALKDIGIDFFLENLDKYTETNYDRSDLSGIVYKIKHDSKKVRNTYIKLLSGELNVRDFVEEEKITQIKMHNGFRSTMVDSVFAGDVFSVTGINNLNAGDSFGKNVDNATYKMLPTLKSKLTFDASTNPKDVLSDMRILESEDPSLSVAWVTQNSEILIGIMGVIQIEILQEVILNRFGYSVNFEEPSIIYKETIDDEVIGYGHFEPLKHYCEVHLKLSKGKEGSGVTFDSKCAVENLSIGHQNLVRHYIFERAHNGILTGSELTDVKITLLTGRSHNMHTSGGDFREATLRALRQGLEQAKSVLLEPVYSARIIVPMTFLGRVISDIQKSFGESEASKQMGDNVMIQAKVPVSTFKNYSTELASFTSGRGRVSLRASKFWPCHNQEEVIDKIEYRKDLDVEYPSSSIFCTKGKGYTVKWDVAKDYMHCIK